MTGISTVIGPGLAQSSARPRWRKSSGGRPIVREAVVIKLGRWFLQFFGHRPQERREITHDKLELLHRQERLAERAALAGVDAEIVERLRPQQGGDGGSRESAPGLR